jgi:hypothetical protein
MRPLFLTLSFKNNQVLMFLSDISLLVLSDFYRHVNQFTKKNLLENYLWIILRNH